MKTFLTGMTALLLTASAPAQSADAPICQVTLPQPIVDWQGEAEYLARAEVRNGRVTKAEITSLRGGVDRRAQRALTMAITQALHEARCLPGDHVHEQRFSFHLGTPPVSTACVVDEPKTPETRWKGRVSMAADAGVRNGRVTHISARPLTSGVDESTLRAISQEIHAVLKRAQCPAGEHLIKKRYDFDLQ